jgi:tRNA-specific 2-thiouridylase
VVGEHVGLAFYTLGQRKGVGVGGQKAGSGEAWYVARKDMATNTLQIVQGHDHPWLASSRLRAADGHWIAGKPPQPACALGAKTRYRQSDARCSLIPDLNSDRAFELEFEQAQWAVTPGQSAVLYDGEVCLGGGVITDGPAPALPQVADVSRKGRGARSARAARSAATST